MRHTSGHAPSASALAAGVTWALETRTRRNGSTPLPQMTTSPQITPQLRVTSFKASESLLSEVRQQANAAGTTMGQIIRVALEAELERRRRADR